MTFKFYMTFETDIWDSGVIHQALQRRWEAAEKERQALVGQLDVERTNLTKRIVNLEQVRSTGAQTPCWTLPTVTLNISHFSMRTLKQRNYKHHILHTHTLTLTRAQEDSFPDS